jgi:hypothetical protein
MFAINTVVQLSKYLNTFENVNMRLDDYESIIYLNHSAIAKGVFLDEDEIPIEKLRSLKEEESQGGVEIFVYTDDKIFFDSERELDSPLIKMTDLGKIEAFIRYLFDKHPEMQPVEFKLEIKGSEIYQLTNNLNKTICQLRVEKGIYQDELDEATKVIDELTKENEIIGEALEKCNLKNNLLTNSVKYLHSKHPIISQNQFCAINEYVNQQMDKLFNKTISIYENSFVSITFNSLENAGNDLFGSPIKQVSPTKTCIIFDNEGKISNDNNYKITFQLDWETFIDLDL